MSNVRIQDLAAGPTIVAGAIFEVENPVGTSGKQTFTQLTTFMQGALGLTNFTFAGPTANRTYTFPDAAASIAALNLADQVVTGGANVTALSLTTGNVTIDCGARPLQYITNNGAYTITAPASDGSCMLLVTNGASAGATTFTGFSVGSSVGDALDTTNGHKFTISIWRINGTSGYRIAAHQ